MIVLECVQIHLEIYKKACMDAHTNLSDYSEYSYAFHCVSVKYRTVHTNLMMVSRFCIEPSPEMSQSKNVISFFFVLRTSCSMEKAELLKHSKI